MITTEKKFLYKPQKLTILNCKIYHIPIFCIRKELNNIKLEPLNPSNIHIIHKKPLYYATTKYVHMNGKVCAHTDTNKKTTIIVNNALNNHIYSNNIS